MRVLLVNPPWDLSDTGNAWRSVNSVMPPLGLAWLAAVLEADGHTVRILDTQAEPQDLEAIAGAARAAPGWDWIGITATTPLISNALRIAERIRTDLPDTRLVLGGVHPTVRPEETLEHSAVDVVVRGEGEMTALALCRDQPLAAIEGISWRNDAGEVIHNPDRPYIEDLDSLPLPAYHLLPMQAYRPAAGAARRLPAVSVLATRGCPAACSFCHNSFGRRLRVRSGDAVAGEVALLQRDYGIREVCFYDDTFTAKRREVQAFCEGIRQRGLDLTWSCFSRVDTFHEETFRLMKEAGCHQVMYGVETNDPQILANLNKRVKPERAAEVIRATRRIGITVRAAFMLGSPGETEETLAANIRYAIELEPDIAIFNITTPYPGTEMFRWAEENGYLLTTNWDDYDLSQPVMRLPTVSTETVQAYYKRAYRRFYWRPAYILKRLVRMLDPVEFISTLRAATLFLRLR